MSWQRLLLAEQQLTNRGALQKSFMGQGHRQCATHLRVDGLPIHLASRPTCSGVYLGVDTQAPSETDVPSLDARNGPSRHWLWLPRHAAISSGVPASFQCCRHHVNQSFAKSSFSQLTLRVSPCARLRKPPEVRWHGTRASSTACVSSTSAATFRDSCRRQRAVKRLATSAHTILRHRKVQVRSRR